MCSCVTVLQPDQIFSHSFMVINMKKFIKTLMNQRCLKTNEERNKVENKGKQKQSVEVGVWILIYTTTAKVSPLLLFVAFWRLPW